MVSPKKKNQKTRVLLHLLNREKNFFFDMISSLSLLLGKQPLKKEDAKKFAPKTRREGLKVRYTDI